MQSVENKDLANLIELAKQVLSNIEALKKEDQKRELLIYFMYKQLDHAMSVHTLYPSIDIALIARTMIEGHISLIWMLEDNTGNRTKEWFTYSSVFDKKLSNFKESRDQEIEKNSNNLVGLKSIHVTKNGKPRDNHRGGENLGNMSNTDDLKYFYKNYKMFSDWVHWNIGGLKKRLWISI